MHNGVLHLLYVSQLFLISLDDFINYHFFSMKKLLLLIIFIGSVLHAHARSVDSPQVQSAAITIDSLSLRLEKLQHDYDYMYCDYEVYKLQMDLKDLAKSIDISSNSILLNVYNSRYNNDLYEVYLANYTSSCDLFESLKNKIEPVKTLVFLKILMSGFTDKEIDVLTSSFSVIDKSVIKVQNSLDYHDVVLKMYKSKR